MADDLKSLLHKRETLMTELEGLNTAIAAKQQEARKESIEKIKRLMEEAGLSPADFGQVKTTTSTSSTRSTKGRKVPAKYKNPATGETWSGRGIKPKWLQEALKTGKSIDDFAIKA
jgi:DNA-binding protein H-NS